MFGRVWAGNQYKAKQLLWGSLQTGRMTVIEEYLNLNYSSHEVTQQNECLNKILRSNETNEIRLQTWHVFHFFCLDEIQKKKKNWHH